jgi:hypothetical protein
MKRRRRLPATSMEYSRDDFILINFNKKSYMDWCKENNHHDDCNDNEDDSNSNAAASLKEVKNARSTVMQSYSTSRNDLYILN